MRIDTTIDPFQLSKLAEDIDRRAFRIMTQDFNAVVSPEALASLKGKLRQQFSTLVAEFVTDLTALKQKVGCEELLHPENRIPTPAEMADQFPLIYAPPPDEGTEPAARQAWAVRRLNWIIASWLQAYGALQSRVASDGAVTATVDPDEEVAGGVEVAVPLVIGLAADMWQLVKRLTFEYLQVKAELLQAHGIDVPAVSIMWEREQDQAWKDAEKAFWSNSLCASTLLAQALREALLAATGLLEPKCPIDLCCVPTAQLPFLAARSGVPLPFPPQRLGDVAFHLEGFGAHCITPPVSILYPLYRIVGEAAAALNEFVPDESVRQRALHVLEEAIREQSVPASPQADH